MIIHPLKQGLKPSYLIFNNSEINCHDYSSTKTRIETDCRRKGRKTSWGHDYSSTKTRIETTIKTSKPIRHILS